MKVALVAPFPPFRGGIAQHSAQLAKALIATQHNITLYSWRSQYPKMFYRRPEIDTSVTAFSDAEKVLQWWNPFSWISLGKKLRHADLIIFPWTVPFHAPHYLTMMSISKTPAVLMVHNALPHEPFPAARFLARQVFKRSSRLVTHARSIDIVCKQLANNIDSFVVPLPSVLSTIEKPPPPAPPFRLLALGYLRHYKGTDLAIEAVAYLKSRGNSVHLTVAGEPWDGNQEYWERYVEELQVNNEVTLKLKYQSDSNLTDLLAEHHALIAPYRSATQSGVVALALDAGRPVIATRVGGLPEVVTEGINGALAEPESLESLVEAIIRVKESFPNLIKGSMSQQTSWVNVVMALLGED